MSTITQEAYDEEIRELMEGLGMTEEEAIEDAIKCYEMKVLTVASLCLHRLSVKNILFAPCARPCDSSTTPVEFLLSVKRREFSNHGKIYMFLGKL